MKKQTKKKIKYKDTWVLHTGVFELHWKNDKPTHIRIEGCEFKLIPFKDYCDKE
jgi:hypothetical protein